MIPIPMPGRRALAALTLTASLGTAAAGMHQICYEGARDQGHRTIVVGCRDDAGGSCQVRGAHNARNHSPSSTYIWPAMRTASFSFLRPTAGSLPVKATLEFFDAAGALKATRECTVELGVHLTHGGPASPGAYLVGFSTDVSGLAMTGIWRANFTGAGNDIAVPGDFVAVSGGVETSPGAFVSRSERASVGQWSSSSFDDAGGFPSNTVTYAVGLKIEGLPAMDEFAWDPPGQLLRPGLSSLIQLDSAFSPGAVGGAPEAVPTATATWTAFDRVALAGEFRARADHSNSPTLRGQYATVNAPRMGNRILRCLLIGVPCPPAFAEGWRAESKDDAGSHPGSIEVGLWHLPAKLEVKGKVYEVRGKVVSARSALGPQPGASASGLLGEYAVTATGGEVHWRGHGSDPQFASNRLVQLKPQFEQVDATVSSRHGSVPTPSTLSAYALGIKLVPEGTPPESDGRPLLRARDWVSPFWLCSAFEGLDGWRGCEEDKPLQLGMFCQYFPDLRDHGLCDKP